MRAGILVLVVLATTWFLKAASSLLVPIAIAALIACALEPVVAWMERRRIPRIAGASMLVLLLVALSGWGLYSLRDVGVVQDGDVTRGLAMGGAALAITSLEGWLITTPLLGKAERMNVVVVFLGFWWGRGCGGRGARYWACRCWPSSKRSRNEWRRSSPSVALMGS